eukprot:TRINITY_DN5039_c0_g1_i2.p1 TRINITY_DN5039_c0_g1~~TRINITY_DN5039_c0_g1_i2.p1  ORF type:complete len:696 (+),score=154.40 TRINITY_DN5039_c0_g1_i2:15-2102(+)
MRALRSEPLGQIALGFTKQRRQFGGPRSSHWRELNAQQKVFQRIAQEFFIQKPEDWFNISTKDVQTVEGGRQVLACYDGSLGKALSVILSDQKFKPWKWKVAKTFWEDRINQRDFLDTAYDDLKLASLEDWYNVEPASIVKLGGEGLLEHFSGSLPDALTSVYTAYGWKRWKFQPASLDLFRREEVQREFMEDLAKKLRIERWEDWYQIKAVHFREVNGGAAMLKVFDNDPALAVMRTFKEHAFDAKKFASSATADSEKEVLENIASKLGLKELNDWYQVSKSQVLSSGGGWVLKRHNNSLVKALTSNYPEHDWKEWKFETALVPNGFWVVKANQRSFFDDLARQLKLETWQDWYLVKRSTVVQHGGRSLLEHYNSRLRDALVGAYPEHDWDLTKFGVSEKDEAEVEPKVERSLGVWKDHQDRRDFFDRMASRLSVKKWEDWYDVTGTDFAKHGGGSLLKYFNNQLSRAVMSTYPEHDWKGYKFHRIPLNYWNDKENQRSFFADLGKKLNFQRWEDWYQISKQEIVEFGGASLLSHYGRSLIAAVTGAMDEYPWDLDRFPIKEEGYWKVKANQRQFMDRMSKVFNIQHHEDWLRVKASDVQERGGSTLLGYYNGSLLKTVTAVYPEHPWDSIQHRSWFQKGYTKTQQRLFRALQEAFPSLSDIHVNYTHPELRYLESKRFRMIDRSGSSRNSTRT